MQRRQPPADVQPQPEQRGQLGVGKVGFQVAGDVEERFLNERPTRQGGPQPRVDAAVPPCAAADRDAFEQRRHRLAVAAAELLDRVVVVAGHLSMRVPHILVSARRSESRTDRCWGGNDRELRSNWSLAVCPASRLDRRSAVSPARASIGAPDVSTEEAFGGVKLKLKRCDGLAAKAATKHETYRELTSFRHIFPQRSDLTRAGDQYEMAKGADS